MSHSPLFFMHLVQQQSQHVTWDASIFKHMFNDAEIRDRMFSDACSGVKPHNALKLRPLSVQALGACL